MHPRVVNQYRFTQAVPTRYPDIAKMELPDSISETHAENLSE
jgi:hypothetical protein